jgi:hypothetical protein
MNPLTCNEAEELLDLYAAGESDPATAAAVERHLTGCPVCAAAEQEARRVLALLDVRAQAPAGLERLKKRIDKEDRLMRQRRRVLPFASLLTAAAALVLFTVGLTGSQPGAWDHYSSDVVADARVFQAKKSPPGGVELVPGIGPDAEARFDQKVALAADQTLTVVLDRSGKTADEYRRHLRETRHAAKLPPPPALDLALELRNPGSAEKVLYLEDERTNLSLDLQGPGVLRLNVPGDALAPFPLKPIRLSPGQSKPLPIRLIDGNREQIQYVYPTEPGDYILTIRLRVPASEQAPNSPQSRPSIKDLDCVTFVSRPVRIKVVLDKR